MYLKLALSGKNDLWRYVVTLSVVFITKIITELPLVIIMKIKATQNGDLNNIGMYLNADKLNLSQNELLLIAVAPLILMVASLIVCMSLLHGFSIKQVFTSYQNFRWKNFFVIAGIWFVLLAVADIIQYCYNPGLYSIHFSWSEFIPLVLICIILVPFQTSWEELYFRGNLMQGLGVLSNSRIFALVLTSTAFGMMHFFNPEVEEFGKLAAMVNYIGMGLILGIIVIMDGGLEGALGLHFINNFYLFAFVSYKGSVFETPAMFQLNDTNPIYITAAFVVAAIILIITASRILKWKSFKWLLKPINQ